MVNLFWRVALALLPAQWLPAVHAPEMGAVNRGVRILSWNGCNFGKSKSDGELAVFADVVKDYDIVTIQEVSTSDAGEGAVQRLIAKLRSTGAVWNYELSPPTSGEGSERYVYLWKPQRAKMVGRGFLEPKTERVLNREPYMIRFAINRDTLLLASMHAVPQSKHPADEARVLSALPTYYAKTNRLLLMGDFNLPHTDPAWDAVKRTMTAAIANQKTTLKMKLGPHGEQLANAYDNIFYETGDVALNSAGIVKFYERYPSMEMARKISDHVPVWVEVRVR